MNGYQLTKQYFAFAAANPGATTPGMCALFMWLVEVNNRSRFTQNFFFNAEDAGYACGMQSRKTVWKYLVQLEVAGLVHIVYKSNNQERPSVLSLNVESGSGGSSSSRWYGGESFGGDSGLEDDSLVAGNGGVGDTTLVDGSDLGLGFDNGALVGSDDDVTGDFGNNFSDDIGPDVREHQSVSVGKQLLHNADSANDHRHELGNVARHHLASLAHNGELPDNASSPKNNIVNNTLSVSKVIMGGAPQNPETGQGAVASAGRSHHPKNQSTAPYLSAETTCKPVIIPKSNPTPTTTKSSAQTTAAHNKAATKPATATATATATQKTTATYKTATKKTTATTNKAAKKTATATATATKMARLTPPPKHCGNTASPALAHSYKGLNHPNQKNRVNGAHLGFGAMQEPDLTEVSTFFTQHGYTANAAEKAWAHYRQANWHDVQGRPVLNWQQKCRTIWFTPENRIPTTQTRFVQ